MWVFGTFVYTFPAVVITLRLLSPQIVIGPKKARSAWAESLY
jgi:hypothetical protein